MKSEQSSAQWMSDNTEQAEEEILCFRSIIQATNPELSWQKQNSTRRKISSPANWT
jgi:hypothetical protein